MKKVNPKTRRVPLALVLVLILQAQAFSQSCPTSGLTTLGTFPNTYYPATSPSLSSGGKSIDLGPVPTGYGSDPIAVGDILLIIQMQGAQIYASNSNKYGNQLGSSRGYLTASGLVAGNMEFVVAANSVTTAGGTLKLTTGLKNSYQYSLYSSGTYGQYIYQLIRIPTYYNLTLGSNLSVPSWNGTTGGVLVLAATNNFDMGGYNIDGAGAGFRGGGTRMLTGGTGNGNDYMTLSTVNTNGGKGEGIAGTPRFLNYNGALLDNGSTAEGYPGGAEARGAPGNAGGGGTDYDSKNNDQNSGGGGGGNGGIGGTGGNSWSTGQAVGGYGGANFAQVTPSRMVMGGGGGGGTSNNGTGGLNGYYSSGTAGGGIVMIYANTITGFGIINVNGIDGFTNVGNDGSGGAGAGGSVLLFAQKAGSFTGITVTANGGAGGSNSGNGAAHGPGGGGAGGVIYSTSALNGASSATGGAAGTTYGGINYGAGGGNAGISSQTIVASQINTFPMSSCTVLPVNFLSVSAQPSNGNVILTWTVESPTATGYAVERSFDGNNFDPIATVAARGGNASAGSYTYTDNNANSPTGMLYYRIEEEDVTGENTYSTVVAVKLSNSAAAAGIYPNPARESLTLTFTSSAAGAVSLRLFDLSGRMVLNRPIQANTGLNAVTIEGLGTLPEGLYLLQWFDGLKPWTSKVMIRH